MSGVTNSQQEEDKKPNDQSAHINLKVKGQVSLYFWVMVLFLYLPYSLFGYRESGG